MALFLVKVSFIDDVEKRMSVRPKHREFLTNLFETGRLYAAGPFLDEKGGISIYEASDLAEAEATLAKDPYAINGIFATTEIREWNAILTRGAVSAAD
ncbi:MAG: YciI family protein [Thermomicrobiales bacterium]